MLFTTGCGKQNDVPTASEHKPKILETAIPVEEDGVLNYIPNNSIEENSMQELWFFQNQLLSSYSIYNVRTNTEILHLRLLSLDSGEILCETELETSGSYAVTIQAFEDHIVVSDAQTGKIHVFDETLQETKTYEASADRIYVNPSVTKAYCLTSSDGIHIVDLETKDEEVLLKNTTELFCYSCSETDISIKYIDLTTVDKKECYAGLNLATGTLEVFEIDDSFSGMEYHNGIWASELLAYKDTYFLGKQEDPFKFNCDASYPTLSLVGNPTRLILTTTTANGTQTMSAYETDGTFLSTCSSKGTNGTFTLKQLWHQNANGYFLLMIDNSGKDQLYFWDVSKTSKADSLDLISYFSEEQLGGTILEQTYYDQTKTLSEKCGATIKIADQCETTYLDHIVEQECDLQKVKTGLAMIEKALTSYPDGFFQQLRYGNYRKIEINLAGEIATKEQIDSYTPTAFLQHENGKITMVLNINETADIIEQNFYHESSHMIDKVLEHNALYRTDAIYSEEKWWSFNPKEFIALNPEYGGYYVSYEMMPMEYYQELFTTYFANDYGKSFSTEDRATILEAAMMGTSQIFSPNISKPLHDKLEYYCQSIRDCFDTTGWPTYTTWENTLRKAEGRAYE